MEEQIKTLQAQIDTLDRNQIKIDGMVRENAEQIRKLFNTIREVQRKIKYPNSL